MVDYTAWLNDPLPEGSKLEDQVVLGERLQNLWNAEPDGPLFHGFAAFDPARNALEDGAPLGLVKQAVLERGFLGVKMYPVMGFAPTGNANDPGSYPRSIRRAFTAKFGTDQTIGRELDRSLHALYDWASAEGVPILAHANSSYSSNGKQGVAYRARAHPARWEPVFEKFWDLRVCLAHFGDFNNANKDLCRAAPRFDRQGFQLGTRDRFADKCGKAWEYTTVELLDRFPGRAYADVSYHHLSYKNSVNTPAWRNAVKVDPRPLEGWQHVREVNPALRGFMFGTDWFLTGQERHHAGAVSDLDDFLVDFKFRDPDVRKAVFRGTALEFLGLVPDRDGPGGASYRRLVAYYDRTEGLDPGRLERFVKYGA